MAYSEFYERAVAIVEQASPEQISAWAVEYWESRLRNETREKVRLIEVSAERAAQNQSASPLPDGWEGRGRSPLRSFGVTHEQKKAARSARASQVWEKRKEEEAEVAAEDVDLRVASPDAVILKYPSQVHSLRIKVGSSLHGARPEKWNALSSEERELFVRALPAHPSIDRESPEWLAYLGTPAGKIGQALSLAGDNESLSRTARRNALLNKLRLDVAIEWTRDILSAEFALSDGRRVTWGSATVEQHRARVALLHGNMAVNAETAARHDAALQTLAESGASCLNEVK